MNSENDVLIERSRHLINISRYEEAIKALKQVLTTDQENFEANLLLAGCLYDQQKFHESFEYSNRLMSIAPDVPASYYYHALNFGGLRDYANSEKFIDLAIELDPYDADFWSLKSWLYIVKKKWSDALDFAEKGLSIYPEHIQCLNNKSTCLIKLNKIDQLEQNIQETLAQDPENYYSHANAGWVELEKGNYKKAKEHFLESLRLNPANEPARNGVIQTLKSRNWFFRLFLKYYFWIGKHQGYAQWAIIIGVYIGGRAIRKLSEIYPYLLPVSILFSIMVYLTWIINPLFNLFLSLDPLGKHVLNKNEKTCAGYVAAGLLFASISLGLWLYKDVEQWLYTSLIFATILIPISSYYELEPYQSKTKVGWLTVIMACLGFTSITMYWLGIPSAGTLMSVYFILIWLYGWLVNYLISK